MLDRPRKTKPTPNDSLCGPDAGAPLTPIVGARRVRKTTPASAGAAAPFHPCQPPYESAAATPSGGGVPPEGDEGGHAPGGTQAENAALIVRIVQMYRLYRQWEKAKVSLVLQARGHCRAYVRTAASGPKLNKAESAEADRLFAAAQKGEDVPLELAFALAPYLASIAHFEGKGDRAKKIAPAFLADYKKKLEAAVAHLPAYGFVKSIKGFGTMNFARLIGEAGDIGAYRNPSCLWKRMGLAVIDGERQRKCANGDKAMTHGYAPQHHAVAFVLSDCLMKQMKGTDLEAVYADYKQRQMAQEGMTKIKAHKRAQRYLVKRVLRELWRAWRGETISLTDARYNAEGNGGAAHV